MHPVISGGPGLPGTESATENNLNLHTPHHPVARGSGGCKGENVR